MAPAVQAHAQPATKDPEHVSIGSSASHLPADMREIINDRQDKDARVCIEHNHRRCLEAWNTDARQAG
jgi:hypothetical protein